MCLSLSESLAFMSETGGKTEEIFPQPLPSISRKSITHVWKVGSRKFLPSAAGTNTTKRMIIVFLYVLSKEEGVWVDRKRRRSSSSVWWCLFSRGRKFVWTGHMLYLEEWCCGGRWSGYFVSGTLKRVFVNDLLYEAWRFAIRIFIYFRTFKTKQWC